MVTRLLAFALIVVLSLVALERFDRTPTPLLVSRLTVQYPTASTFKTDSPLYPPVRYRGDADTIIVFRDLVEVNRLCGVEMTKNHMALGCVRPLQSGTAVMVVPNPCLVRPGELYAAILCHELGHVNGWVHAA